ncbi:CUN060 hypothetical protein [Culex nigripalpus nucleopolyhedrovirus]|uniref:Uncharacterized protein n=1 Tax=Culex nigripalpus nucleopolyhedrovirus (isolate Florida/1997) TaxID=645993 RepID=Q919L6_NPVCO|nr:CUN060 hypothetical protein [Culex nigripalpus nucleopolyhedrovirus]AAK94138.1 CUN060 hypothetical protein [Culex nigripalpus nucleopolyhedrovirus]
MVRIQYCILSPAHRKIIARGVCVEEWCYHRVRKLGNVLCLEVTGIPVGTSVAIRTNESNRYVIAGGVISMTNFSLEYEFMKPHDLIRLRRYEGTIRMYFPPRALIEDLFIYTLPTVREGESLQLLGNFNL